MKLLSIVCFIYLLFNFSLACAQEITPELKYNSIRAPAGIKIDGKADEWGNKLHAYSSHTQFYYTVSNDDKYLYLTIETADNYIINRILKAGITFTINKSGTKKDTAGIHITYPLLNRYSVYFNNAPKIKDQSPANLAKIDTFVTAVNDQLDQRSKLMKVSGIKNVDTLISVYNLDGIKAAAYLDHKMRYTYELAVSLQNLGLTVKEPVKFMYQVMINELDTKTFKFDGEIKVTISGGRFAGQDATDFWDEYTLAK